LPHQKVRKGRSSLRGELGRNEEGVEKSSRFASPTLKHVPCAKRFRQSAKGRYLLRGEGREEGGVMFVKMISGEET